MTSTAKSVFTGGVLVCVLSACGSAADDSENSLSDEEHVRVWATTASAVAVYSNVRDPIAFADGEQTFADPACPLTSDDGITAVISGGCVDSSGRRWIGRATIVRSEDGGRELTLESYANYDDPAWLVSFDGSVNVRRVDADRHEFDVSLVHSGGTDTIIEYSGSVQGGYSGRTVWNGSGTASRSGGFAPNGTISATTVDEVVDGAVCSGQPVSGRTTLTDGRTVTVVTYDGASDCDDEQAARWSVDGRDRGRITGITCHSAGAGIAPGAGGAALVLLFGAAGRSLRRRSGTRAGARGGVRGAREHR